jgi:PAS domain S-box-containing protein
VQAGAQDYLIKGEFDQEQLAKSLRFSIERARVLKRLEETQDIAHIGNWEYVPDLPYFLASNEIYKAIGTKSGSLPRQTQQSIECDPAFALLGNIHQQASIYGEFKNDIEIQHTDGTIRYAYVECRYQENHKGKVAFQGILQDITDRKIAEQEVAKNKERYQDLFTQSKDAIMICSLDGNLLDFNQATIDLFGYDREEINQAFDVHTLYHSKNRKNEFLLKLKTNGSVKDFDITAVRKDGSCRDCLISATISHTGEGNFYSCFVRDITEQRQAEKLRKAKELAEQTSRMKEQFVASISHEMRTPMNAIFGMSNLLLQSELDSEQLELAASIKKSSEVLLGIINDILEISSIQNGRIEFENKTFDLLDLLHNVVNVMRYKASEKDISIELFIDEDVPQFISGDPLRLNQILYNLVGNGIKFTERGFVNIRVKKLFDILDNVQLQFTIEDSGMGIPDDMLQNIFESFTRVRYKDKVIEGTGLGLSISKNLVELQGGKIIAESTVNKGSTFIFDLLYENAVAPENRRTDAALDFYTLETTAPIRLLLVEDHKLNQMVAIKTLKKKWENINIEIAENGEEALRLLENHDFDLILMDIQMPVMDGYEATRIIRQEFPPAKAKIPILAMTAHAHISKEGKFKEFGLDDYVLKPFEPEELFTKINIYRNKS